MENKERTFKEIVQAMTAKEIIMAMVEGLKNPALKIDMDQYVGIEESGVCVGCAAANTIARLSGKRFTVEDVLNVESEDHVMLSNRVWGGVLGMHTYREHAWLMRFERAIDALRSGDIESYNDCARILGIALIQDTGPRLRMMCTDNYAEYLGDYEKLAELQP